MIARELFLCVLRFLNIMNPKLLDEVSVKRLIFISSSGSSWHSKVVRHNPTVVSLARVPAKLVERECFQHDNEIGDSFFIQLYVSVV